MQLRKWKIEQIAQLQADLEHALRRYEAQCHDAAQMAPEQWREYWKAEAHSASLHRQSLLRKVNMFLDYAKKRNVETLRGG
jgi:hypothetical protein